MAETYQHNQIGSRPFNKIHMIVYRKMKSLGSGQIAPMPINIPNITTEKAIRLAFLKDARLYYKVFGKERARQLLSDTIYSITTTI